MALPKTINPYWYDRQSHFWLQRRAEGETTAHSPALSTPLPHCWIAKYSLSPWQNWKPWIPMSSIYHLNKQWAEGPAPGALWAPNTSVLHSISWVHLFSHSRHAAVRRIMRLRLCLLSSATNHPQAENVNVHFASPSNLPDLTQRDWAWKYKKLDGNEQATATPKLTKY